MSGQSSSGEPSDGGQNLVCGFGPSKGLRLLVVDFDELPDGVFKLFDAAMRTTFDLPLGEQCEPTLDLVEPGGVRGSEVQMVAWALYQPAANQRRQVEESHSSASDRHLVHLQPPLESPRAMI